MNRSKEISEILAESSEILQKGSQPRKDPPTERELALTSLLQKAVKMLYTHPDCVDHLKHDLDDDFANLPTEVVHDVIELASFEDEKVVTDLKKLALIDGSWAEFGNEFASANRSLRKTIVDRDTHFDELKAKASQLCEHVHLLYAPHQFYETLELMETRFSSITWYADENLSKLASLQMTRFLERQLKSKHLRKICIWGKVDYDLSKLFVEFVKRPHFQDLWVRGDNRIPFEVLEAAHKSWVSQVPQNSPLCNKEISAMISHETARKLKEHFNVSEESVCLKHPVHGEAETYLRVSNVWPLDVRMTLDSLAERSGCVERSCGSDSVDFDSFSDDYYE